MWKNWAGCGRVNKCYREWLSIWDWGLYVRLFVRGLALPNNATLDTRLPRCDAWHMTAPNGLFDACVYTSHFSVEKFNIFAYDILMNVLRTMQTHLLITRTKKHGIGSVLIDLFHYFKSKDTSFDANWPNIDFCSRGDLINFLIDLICLSNRLTD